ncbi:TrmB family transcriptional regulator [Haloferax profundi]|uniref:Transcription regulator TrmB N-terminal domain-containing protein n=1 Tax=Haloferax profundi TaxID=1544718 RepID=A0A0W1SM96_9EURY|nr:helix-turn-helix domain-containing protein [Haloferax profundi]KTG27097.1 hypothetical protein AUR66_00610 [Haloferax profundi]
MTVDTSDVAESLEWFGLSNYEAQVFVALHQLGLGTAKEIAEVTDVPQSQVYGAAAALEKSGLIEVQRSNPKRYRPIEIDQALDYLESEYHRRRAQVSDGLHAIREQYEDERSESQEHVWTVTGSAAVLSRISTLIDDATDSLIVGIEAASPISEQIVEKLQSTKDESVDITIISTSQQVLDSLKDIATVYNPPLPPQIEGTEEFMSGHILIADDEAVLMSACASAEEVAIWCAGTSFARVLIDMSKARLEILFDESESLN